MDRCAVFVDVGYLYAAGGTLCIGDKSRRNIDLNIAGVVATIAGKAAFDCGQRLLRTYWYDGARRGVPTPEHIRAGRVDDVKVRLGSINSAGQQKGVDALVYRDLMTLARERAITHAYLLAGDADLVEGVRAAQDMGTHVTLLYIDAGADQGTSPDLMHESDRRVRLSRADLSPHFAVRSRGTSAVPPRSRPVTPPDEFTTPGDRATGGTGDEASDSTPRDRPAEAVGSAASDALGSQASDVAPTPEGDASPEVEADEAVTPAGGDLVTVESAARAFAQTWLDTAFDHDVRALAVDHPRIPAAVDSALLRAIEAAMERSLRTDEPTRRCARQAFWDAIHETVSV